MQIDLGKARTEEARKDARRKIELGGLIIKSGLDREPKDVILGALLSIAEELHNVPGSRQLFQSKGMQAFLKT